MIEIEALEQMFENMRADSSWNIDGPLLWGYFFTDDSEEKLLALVPVLEAQGYRFVDLYVPDLDDNEEEYFFLHVEKEEVHSVNSLHERNQHLYALAEHHNIDCYDGMDVGPIEPT